MAPRAAAGKLVRRYTLKTLIDTPLKRARSPSSFAMAALEGRKGRGIGDVRAGIGAPRSLSSAPLSGGGAPLGLREPPRAGGRASGGWPHGHGLLRARPVMSTLGAHGADNREAGELAAHLPPPHHLEREATRRRHDARHRADLRLQTHARTRVRTRTHAHARTRTHSHTHTRTCGCASRGSIAACATHT